MLTSITLYGSVINICAAATIPRIIVAAMVAAPLPIGP